MANIGETYLQFPLCALAFCSGIRERLDCVISFGFVEAGITMFRSLDPQRQRIKADEFSGSAEKPSDYKKNNANHVAAMIGAQRIGITIGSVAASLERWRRLCDFRDRLEEKHGRDARVRIAKYLVFETRDKTGIAYREFAMLCAIYSCIGVKQHPVRITRQMIQFRMLGYKTQAVMNIELGQRADGAKPLSLRQINYTLDKLHERRFFARARANERQTFYSHRMNQDELEKRLIDGKSYSHEFHERRRKRDAALIAEIKERKSAIKANDLL